MKIIKKYTAIDCKKMLFNITVNGETKRCSFSGYDSYTGTNGSFITDDEKLQEALEESPSFNRLYKLASTETVLTQEDIEEEKEKIALLEEIHFANLGEAKKYIENMFAFKGYKIKNQEHCIEKGREYGLNIIFDNAK